MASKHTRKLSSRAPLPRRTTKGPLDGDPLSNLATTITSPLRSSVASPALSVPDANSEDGFRSSGLPSPMIMDEPSIAESAANAKDLSFLLEPSIYHPLSQLDLPAPFRRPFPPLPLATTPLAQSLSTLDALLAKSDFLCAAHIAGGILSSSSLRPTDTKTIFRLLSIRFSCLELTGGSLLAAQESKALEDLISTFYYYDAPEVPKASEEDAAPPEHIMPFSLRLQALRLQSIGFSDPRRGVSALYDLGVECREHIGHSTTSDENRTVWRARLEEIGIRVVNALIEMGDIDCARRTLEANIAVEATVSTENAQRIALLYVKIGDIKKAQAVQHAAGDLLPLLAIAKGRYEEAAKYWEAQLDAGTTEDKASLIRQNLAVAYLYAGMIVKARDILHGLVDEGESFESLTVNLATLYELSSDRSKELKLAAATKIAANQRDRSVMTPLTNVALKL
jgi:tetratricopeptide (TPR) repeat protein